jgi:hypothetical protein
MLPLLIGHLLVRSAFWRRPLAADTCRPVMTYKANLGRPASSSKCLHQMQGRYVGEVVMTPQARCAVAMPPGGRGGFSELSRSAPCVSCETGSGNSVGVPTVCLNMGRQGQRPCSTEDQNNPTYVGARASFDLEIYRRLLAAIAVDLIFNHLSFVK